MKVHVSSSELAILLFYFSNLLQQVISLLSRYCRSATGRVGGLFRLVEVTDIDVFCGRKILLIFYTNSWFLEFAVEIPVLFRGPLEKLIGKSWRDLSLSNLKHKWVWFQLIQNELSFGGQRAVNMNCQEVIYSTAYLTAWTVCYTNSSQPVHLKVSVSANK